MDEIEIKAKEIVIKMQFQNPTLMFDQAKHCALICVDEIISACEFNFVESYNTVWWNKVKEEIKKM